MGARFGIGLMLALACLGCGERPGRGQPPDVVLVTFDTTRADRIGTYGRAAAATPTIDALAGRGVVFDEATAPTPITLPSHATLMTGLYPFHHGVRENSGFVLEPQADTLAERLQRAGYQTAASVGAFVLDGATGLDQGFDAYLDRMPGEAASFHFAERDAAQVVDDALAWFRTRKAADRPFFLWCHFFDPHVPYRPPATFADHPHLGPYDREVAYADGQLRRLLDGLEQGTGGRERIVVVTADHGESLGEHGEDTHSYFAYQSTLHVPLVIVPAGGADEPRRVGVPVGLADIAPTILDLAGLVVPGPETFHGRSLAGWIRGHEDAGSGWRERPVYFESYTPAHVYGWAPLAGVRVGDLKLIEAPIPELYDLTAPDAEDPASNEHGARPDVSAGLSRKLRRLLEAPLGVPALAGTAPDADAETLQRLHSLGYLTGAGTAGSTSSVEDDPKSRLPLFQAIMRAVVDLQRGDISAGVALLLDAWRQDPGNPQVVTHLAAAATLLPPSDPLAGLLEEAATDSSLGGELRARALVAAGRVRLEGDPRRALGLFERAAVLDSGDAAIHGWLTTAHLHLGEADAALRAAVEALRLDPGADLRRVVAGTAAFVAGQAREGQRHWRALLDGGRMTAWRIAELCAPDSRIAATVLGPFAAATADPGLAPSVRAVLHAARGRLLLAADPAGALAELERASALLGGDDAEGLLTRARALARAGRVQEGIALLERARELDPGHFNVVLDLAGAWQARGDVGRAIELLGSYFEDHREDPAAANNLAWMLAGRAAPGDLDRALELATAAVSKRPGDPSFADTLGWVLARRGEAGRALEIFEPLVQAHPRSAGYRYRLGVALRMAGRSEAAREAFERAVELAPARRPDWFDDATAGAAGDP